MHYTDVCARPHIPKSIYNLLQEVRMLLGTTEDQALTSEPLLHRKPSKYVVAALVFVNRLAFMQSIVQVWN